MKNGIKARQYCLCLRVRTVIQNFVLRGFSVFRGNPYEWHVPQEPDNGERCRC